MSRAGEFNMLDLFCGAGGTSEGASQACREVGRDLRLTAVNHWDVAIETHSANHPGAVHYLSDAELLRPDEMWSRGDLDMVWGSPSCPHHSRARGGKPVSDQQRSTGWCVVDHVKAARPVEFGVENVPEYQEWGPVGKRGFPLKRGKGKTFRRWLKAFRDLGYTVEHKVLCCADYGDPTIRPRLFVRGSLRGRPVWPLPTHTEEDYVPAANIIDWSDLGTSIYERKKPLCDNTMRRIKIGLEKFSLEPFLVPQQSRNVVWDPSRAMPSITSKGADGLATPFLITFRGTGTARSIQVPLASVCASGNHQALCQPYIVRLNGQSTAEDVLRPLSTVTNGNHHAVATPFLTKYYGTGGAVSVARPLDVVTCKDRFGLTNPIIVDVNGVPHLVDILYRMLKPAELAAAQGFPEGYHFAGTRQGDIKKQIGNAVPVNTSRAIIKAAMTGDPKV